MKVAEFSLKSNDVKTLKLKDFSVKFDLDVFNESDIVAVRLVGAGWFWKSNFTKVISSHSANNSPTIVRTTAIGACSEMDKELDQ